MSDLGSKRAQRIVGRVFLVMACVACVACVEGVVAAIVLGAVWAPGHVHFIWSIRP